MPTITTAETLCGPRPSPHTNAFLRWVDEYVSRRKRQCMSKRPTVLYVDPSLGTGSNNGTSPANAWRTTPMASVRSYLSANTGGNYSILFKRGTMIRDATGLVLSAASGGVNVHLGSYGALSQNATDGDRPIISHFTVRWTSGGTRWQPASGNRYTTSVAVGSSGSSENPSSAASVGFLRAEADRLNPFTAVASPTECENTPFSFHVASGTVHINLDTSNTGINPNDLDIEAVPVNASAPDGVQILNGSSGVWIDGLRFDGWGAGTKGLTASGSANESGIRNMAGGTAAEGEHVALITNCESYYNGGHAFSQEPNGIGGVHIVENCMAGFGYNAPNGESTFNSYAGSAGHETVFKDVAVRFGPLPQTVNVGRSVTSGTVTTQGKAFYIHAGASPAQPVSLFLIQNATILDERGQFERATVTAENWSWSDVDLNAGAQVTASDSAFTGLSSTDPTAYRAFVIGWKSPRVRVPATNYYLTGSMRVVFINSQFYFRRSWNTQTLEGLSFNWNSMFLNCIFEVDEEQPDRCGLFLEQTNAWLAMQRLINCLILVRGHTDGAQESVLQIFATAGADKQRLANTAIIGWDRTFDPTTGKEVALTRSTDSARILNDAQSLRYIAISGCRLNDSTFPWIGFNAATGLVNLATANNTYPNVGYINGTQGGSARLLSGGYSLDPASPLVGAGAAVPFADKADMLPAPEYDFFGRRRPTTPSIGPFDVLNISTGGGGGGGGSGNRGMVRSPVRPAVSS